ncbi:DUF417 family protein [Candidatus Roizmanbacteria bacterium]|nr:DUF417 family protein [Candidatus Roizmanbacteria bacterium]
MAFIHTLTYFLSAKEGVLIFLLRISLGLVFFWFGALKVAGFNPVYDIVYSTFPMLASGTGNIVLGAVEAVIGILLLLNVFVALAHILLILHLSGTFLTFISAPELMFDPYFPVLTLAGEFVFKNAVLAFAGLVVFAHEERRILEK